MRLLQPGQGERSDVTEEALVRRAACGDAQSFADLYERHLDQVFRYFYYRVGRREDAEDLTERTFLKAWTAIRRYDSRGVPFAAWLFKIGRNVLIDHRRSERETEHLDEEMEIEDEDAGPEEMLARRAEAWELARALRQLSAVEQNVVALRFVQRLDHRTVARIVGKSEVATRSIQSRALARLARILGAGRGGS